MRVTRPEDRSDERSAWDTNVNKGLCFSNAESAGKIFTLTDLLSPNLLTVLIRNSVKGMQWYGHIISKDMALNLACHSSLLQCSCLIRLL